MAISGTGLPVSVGEGRSGVDGVQHSNLPSFIRA